MNNINITLKPTVIQIEIKQVQSLAPIEVGMTMPGPAGKSFETYVHDQMVAASSWVIEHNLSCYPSVTIVDTANNVVIGEIQYISDNSLIVNFSSAFSGKAYIN